MSDSLLEGPVRKPASGGAVKQLVVLLHGVGADGTDLIGLAPMLAEALPDAQFVSPHAPFEYDMAPLGRQWFSLSDRNPVALLEGVRNVEPIVNRYMDDMLRMLGLSDDALAVVGFSQGTMTALHAVPRRAKPCAAVVGFSGALVGADVLASEAASKPPVFLAHGEMDDVVPFAAMGMAEEGLRGAGIEVRTSARPNVGHGIDPEGLDLAAKFLQARFGVAQASAA